MDLRTAKDIVEGILAQHGISVGPKIDLIKALRKAYYDGQTAARQEAHEGYTEGYEAGKKFVLENPQGDEWDKGYDLGSADTKANWDAAFEDRALDWMVKQLRMQAQISEALARANYKHDDYGRKRYED